MITYSKFKSSAIEQGSRILKIFQFGVKTADECAPFGEDGNPLVNMTAIYADTTESGEQIIIGYINTSQLAEPGEKRTYSLKPDGSLSFYSWLKNDGTMELGGTVDNLVRYNALLLSLTDTINKLNAELLKVQSGIATAGGAYAMVPVPLDISESKIEEIKCL